MYCLIVFHWFFKGNLCIGKYYRRISILWVGKLNLNADIATVICILIIFLSASLQFVSRYLYHRFMQNQIPDHDTSYLPGRCFTTGYLVATRQQ
jgi:hypothetical protein